MKMKRGERKEEREDRIKEREREREKSVTPLHDACTSFHHHRCQTNNSPRTVNLSVPMDNGPNGGHQTPLAFIISRCVAKIISEDAAYELIRCLLVECGVDPNVGIRINQSGDVEYPIVMVVRHTLIKIFHLLVEYGADMRSRSTMDGKMEDCAAAAISSLIFCTRTSSRAKCMQMLTLVYERSCRSR